MNIYQTETEESEGDPSVGDEEATPIYEGEIPEEELVQSETGETQESDNEAETEEGEDTQEQSEDTSAPESQQPTE